MASWVVAALPLHCYRLHPHPPICSSPQALERQEVYSGQRALPLAIHCRTNLLVHNKLQVQVIEIQTYPSQTYWFLDLVLDFVSVIEPGLGNGEACSRCEDKED